MRVHKMCVCVYIYIYVCVCVFVSLSLCMYVCIYIYIHICIYIYIYIWKTMACKAEAVAGEPVGRPRPSGQRRQARNCQRPSEYMGRRIGLHSGLGFDIMVSRA